MQKTKQAKSPRPSPSKLQQCECLAGGAGIGHADAEGIGLWFGAAMQSSNTSTIKLYWKTHSIEDKNMNFSK